MYLAMTKVWNSNKLKELLIRDGRKRSWVASECGITLGYLNLMLSGYRKPSLSVLKHLARIFDSKVEDILNETAEEVELTGT
jgi:transcriptional regulator with XRE-family HTH domain